MRTTSTDITLYAYNKNAQQYAEKFSDFKSYKEKITRFQQEFIPTRAHILDVGCGPGNNAKILLAMDDSYKITGIDLSEEMINIAKTNAPGASFKIQDIRHITPGKQYDTIIAAFCIVHLSDHETRTLLKNLSKMLKDNGSLYISFMEGKGSGFETTSFSDDDVFFNYYERNAIIEILLENSIETVEVLNEGYEETDGSVTDDIFIFARKMVTAFEL